MRTVINFSVTGADAGELREKALAQFRDLMGDPEAEIPYSATIEISPETVVEAQDGTKVATQWLGEVNVTIAADGSPR
jgi:hypothetical protein